MTLTRYLTLTIDDYDPNVSGDSGIHHANSTTFIRSVLFISFGSGANKCGGPLSFEDASSLLDPR